MKVIKVLGLAAVFGFMAVGIASAKDLKIAYVDLSRVFDNYQKTKEFDAILQKEGTAFQKERDSMVQKIQDDQSKLNLMKDAEKVKMQADIEKEKNDVVAYDKQKRTDLAKRRDDKVKEILGEIQKIVSGIAKRDDYTYVLNDRVLIYGDQDFNITDEVMKTLNDSYTKK